MSDLVSTRPPTGEEMAIPTLLHFYETHLEVEKTITEEEMEERLLTMTVWGGSIQWYIGDLLLAADELFGAAWTFQHLPEWVVKKYSHHTLENYKWCAKKWLPAQRRGLVDWSLHYELAGRTDRETWLDICEKENLTRTALRKMIDAADALEDEKEKPEGQRRREKGSTVVVPPDEQPTYIDPEVHWVALDPEENGLLEKLTRLHNRRRKESVGPTVAPVTATEYLATLIRRDAEDKEVSLLTPEEEDPSGLDRFMQMEMDTEATEPEGVEA